MTFSYCLMVLLAVHFDILLIHYLCVKCDIDCYIVDRVDCLECKKDQK